MTVSELVTRVRVLNLLAASALLFGLQLGNAVAQTSDLVSKTEFRVCADPANAPQSDDKLNGYENKLADLIAGKLDLEVKYFWFPMSTGFVRKTLGDNQCDVVMGFSAGHELMLNTNPYMTSTYIIVSKKDGPFASVDHLADSKLEKARIGLVAGSAPGSHLVRLGRMAHVVPYQLFVDRRYFSPTERILDDVRSGKTDVAIIWGPIGGPFIKEKYSDLVGTPLLKEEGKPNMFVRITMGVRRGELAWKRKLNSAIRRNQKEIDQLLRQYGVPLLTVDGKNLKPEG